MAFSADAEPRVTHTVNVTPEGAQFADSRPVEPQAMILLRIRVDDETSPLECKGRVCWVRQTSDGTWRFGVRFLDLTDDEHNLIKQRICPLSTVA